MSTLTLDGISYKQMLMGGAAVLSEHIEELNALNVFPVSDGDTGTNMSSTIEGGLMEAQDENEDLGAFSKKFSKGVLLSARGNSGVILSQIFAGIDEILGGFKCVDAKALAEAYRNGIAKSYAAVQNPTEGTILTVFRESTEYAAGLVNENSPVEEFYKNLLDEARRSLAQTTQLLPVLAEADVVDSGAAGYLYITQGMYEALIGAISPSGVTGGAKAPASKVNIDLFTRDSIMELGYCTEFLLRLTTSKVNPDSFDLSTILSDLDYFGGRSVVAYKTGDIVKVHVHTLNPGQILDKMLSYGEFLTVKIENMVLGHSEDKPKTPKINKPYSVVAVSSGEEMSARFRQMGADEIISGGQTQNPSTQDFIDAFKRCASDEIIVLPNNKNIIMAARQAASLYTEANIRVVPTENLMQGYGALNVITPGIKDMDVLTQNALSAARGVKCVEVTRAVRDAVVEGTHIKMGQYMAISDGRLAAVSESAREAAISALKDEDMDLSEIVTIFAGKGISDDELQSLAEKIGEICPDCEINSYIGGQDVYDWLIAIE